MQSVTITRSLICQLGLLLVLNAQLVIAADVQITHGARVAIVVTAERLPAAGQLAIDDLSSYLQRSLKAVVRRYPPGTRLSALDEDAAIVVGASEDAGFVQLVDVETADLGEEGALITSSALDEKPLVYLVGQTWTGACHAVYSFLEQELGIGFFIDGDRVPSLAALDLTGIQRSEIPRVPIRGLFYHPTWPHPHANCCRLWSWNEWKQYLDWMRHRRLNTVLLFHDDGGYSWGDALFNAFPQIPKNDKTLARFIVDPAWRTELNKQIVNYARQSGLKIAYNLFYSQVPEFVADYYPDLETHPLRMRNVGIKYTQPQCQEIMRQLWSSILDTYGVDDSHIYIACSYFHELALPEYLNSRNPPTLEMIDLLRELDPKAEIYIETWCWNYLQEAKTPMTRQQWLDMNALIEWKRFDAEIPRDIGVADWDRKQEPQRVPDPTFGGRPYTQLTHTLMEGWWPPDTVRRNPQWLMDYFNDSIDNGARGLLSFHIQANTNPLLADLTAQIGLREQPLADYYRDYARRRFGAAVGDVMAESLAAFCDAVDLQPADNPDPVRGSLDDKANFLTFPGVTRSAEEMLFRSRELEGNQTAWIERQLEIMRPGAAQAAHALMLARSVAPVLRDDPFFEEYRWQLDYLSARFAGIEGLYRSYLLADTDPAQARQQFHRAVTAFESIKALFAGNIRYKMNELRTVEPDVPYTKSFLDEWEFRGAKDKDTYTFHVVWERFPLFEEFLWSLRPPQLGPVKRAALDNRPWFEATD
ncbi:MAG: hypothetical protein AB7U20_22140 [Planctomycetaceae bacterium]